MEAAKENIGFTIFKGNYEMILSRILCTERDVLSITFPLFSEKELPLVVFIDHKKLTKTSLTMLSSSIQKEDQLYLVNLGNTITKTFYSQTIFRQEGMIQIECSHGELQLLKRITKKLYQMCCNGKGGTTQQLYLSMLLKCAEEFLDRNRIYLSRKDALSQKFLQLLYNEKSPEHNVCHYAALLFVSRRYLTRAVHSCLGLPPKALIDQEIINEAKKMLGTDATIYDIADALKFESPSAFTTFFKKHTGFNPTQYRNHYLNN